MKCVLRLSCATHGPIHGRFMGCTVNSFLSLYKVYYRESKPVPITPYLINGHKSAGKPHRKEETQLKQG